MNTAGDDHVESNAETVPVTEESGATPAVIERTADLLSPTYYGALALAGAVLTLAAALQNRWLGAILGLVLVAGGLATEATERARSLAGFVFGGFAALGVLCVLWGSSPVWSLLGIAAAVGVWDLHHFRRRLDAVDYVADRTALVRNHIEKLGALLGGAVAVGIVALSLRLSYDVVVLALLSLVLIIGLSRGIRFLRRESD